MAASILLAFFSALSYGVSDFFAALGARRHGLLPSTTVVYAFAMVVILAAWPSDPGVWTIGGASAGLAAGVFAVVGFLGFYGALALGPMSVLSPLMAVLGSLVPVFVALARGERLGLVAVLAIVGAVIAAGLVSVERERARRPRPRALLLALVGGLGIGASIAALDFAPDGSGLIPGVLEVALGLVVLVALVGVRRETVRPVMGRAGIGSAVGGALLGAANALLVLALGTGSLAIVAVVVGLYPVVTVVLATIVTRERISLVQGTGIVLALAASVTLGFS